MIKGAVFDVGGVLVDLDLDACRRRFIEDMGFTKITEMLDASHQRGVYSLMEEGKITADEFRADVLRDSRPGARAERVDRCIRAMLVGMDKKKSAYLSALSERIPLFILSNNNPISMPMCREIMEEAGLDLGKVFRKQFVSYEMKLLKPSSEIFRIAVAETGIPAGDLLYVDDSSSNIAAALSVGMKAVLYTPGGDLGALVDTEIRKNGGTPSC